MRIGDLTLLAAGLHGVRESTSAGLIHWHYHSRLVARQLDATHIVIRTPFDTRDAMVRQFPATFSVPSRFTKHMMIVADLANGDPGAIEDALITAWQLQCASN